MFKIRERYLMAAICLLLYWLPIFDLEATSGTLTFFRRALGEGFIYYQNSFLLVAIFFFFFPMKAWQLAFCSLPQFFYTYVALDYWLNTPGAPYQAFAAHLCVSLVFVYCTYTRFYGYFLGHQDDSRTTRKNS